MFSETESVVRVNRYYKTLDGRNANGLPVQYQVDLDWGIGEVDGGVLVIFGSPYQLFPPDDIRSTPIKDTRVLVEPVKLPLSEQPSTVATTYGGLLHFKHPVI